MLFDADIYIPGQSDTAQVNHCICWLKSIPPHLSVLGFSNYNDHQIKTTFNSAEATIYLKKEYYIITQNKEQASGHFLW